MKRINSYNRQLTLPLEVLKEDMNQEYYELVKQNWRITFSRQHISSVFAKRVMGLIASQIREDGGVKEYYQITADKIIQETGLDKKGVYKIMKGVVYELGNITFYLEDEINHTVIPRHLLDTTRFENPAGYYNGTLTVAFNPQLKGIVDHLAHYSKFELKAYVNFHSWYSMRLYELLSAFRDKPFAEWDINHYREWMGCGVELDRQGNPRINQKTGKPRYMKYAQHFDAILRTTSEPLKEFKGTDLEFEVSPVYADGVGRGRPAIKKVRFDFVKKNLSKSQKVAMWVAQSDDFKKIYERLKKYMVSDDVVFEYSGVIGKEKLNKLLHEWDLRQLPNSQNKILNPESFCNKVLRDMGKKLNKLK